MKEGNDKDNLDGFEAHLRQPQKAGGEDSTQLSQVRCVRHKRIREQEWVEAHSESEREEYLGQLEEMMKNLTVYQG
jgi:hypothetical protein